MKRISLLLFVFSIQLYFSQNINFENINSNNILYLLNNTEVSPNYTEKNIVKSSTEVTQIGNENFASINLLYETQIKSAQLGNENTFIYQDFFNPQKNTQITVTALGNGNYVEVLGSNNISDGMKINVTGNDKIIFIRNY